MQQFVQDEFAGISEQSLEQPLVGSPVAATPKPAVSFSFRPLSLAERAPALALQSNIKAGVKIDFAR